MGSKNFYEKLYSKTMWTDLMDPYITDHFIFLGFNCPADFMDIRLFDFFNLNGMDGSIAEEMIFELSRFLYPERHTHSEEWEINNLENQMYLTGLYYNPYDMTIGDLLKDESLSEVGLFGVLNWVIEKFYLSDEYDSQSYKYENLRDIEEQNMMW